MNRKISELPLTDSILTDQIVVNDEKGQFQRVDLFDKVFSDAKPAKEKVDQIISEGYQVFIMKCKL